MLPAGALWCRETAHLAALMSPSSAQQLGIALCGKSLLFILSKLLQLELSLEPAFLRSGHLGA
jgi:hypothetical protein